MKTLKSWSPQQQAIKDAAIGSVITYSKFMIFLRIAMLGIVVFGVSTWALTKEFEINFESTYVLVCSSLAACVAIAIYALTRVQSAFEKLVRSGVQQKANALHCPSCGSDFAIEYRGKQERTVLSTPRSSQQVSSGAESHAWEGQTPFQDITTHTWVEDTIDVTETFSCVACHRQSQKSYQVRRNRGSTSSTVRRRG